MAEQIRGIARNRRSQSPTNVPQDHKNHYDHRTLSYPGIITVDRRFTDLATAFLRWRVAQPGSTLQGGLTLPRSVLERLCRERTRGAAASPAGKDRVFACRLGCHGLDMLIDAPPDGMGGYMEARTCFEGLLQSEFPACCQSRFVTWDTGGMHA